MGRVLSVRGDHDEAIALMRTAMGEVPEPEVAIRIGLDAIETPSPG
jgi:hypothetical protein